MDRLIVVKMILVKVVVINILLLVLKVIKHKIIVISRLMIHGLGDILRVCLISDEWVKGGSWWIEWLVNDMMKN